MQDMAFAFRPTWREVFGSEAAAAAARRAHYLDLYLERNKWEKEKVQKEEQARISKC